MPVTRLELQKLIEVAKHNLGIAIDYTDPMIDHNTVNRAFKKKVNQGRNLKEFDWSRSNKDSYLLLKESVYFPKVTNEDILFADMIQQSTSGKLSNLPSLL